MTLQELIVQAQEMIAEIRKHPEYQKIAVSYSPDLTIADAMAAIQYLEWELQSKSINLNKLEAFQNQ